MSGVFGGNQFQLPIGGYIPSPGNVQSALGTAQTGANQLWGISQPTPTYTNKPIYKTIEDPGKDKPGQPDVDPRKQVGTKRVQTGTAWNPLALQKQLPQYQQDVNQGTAAINQWAPSAMSAAADAQSMGLTAADMASGAVPGLFNIGGLMTGMAPGAFGQAQDVMQSQLAQIPGLQGYANQALQQGFDPQNALFNRTAQQMRDMAGATAAASGVAGSPYGAGVENQAMENFLLDWQDQQLGREQTAAGTAGSLYGTIGGLTAPGESLYNIGQNLATGGANIDTAALGLGQGANQLAMTAGQDPMQMAESIATGKIGLQDALTQAKSNMYNQRTGGFNAQNQLLSTFDNFLKTGITGLGQNFDMQQAGLSDFFTAGGDILKGLSKG